MTVGGYHAIEDGRLAGREKEGEGENSGKRKGRKEGKKGEKGEGRDKRGERREKGEKGEGREGKEERKESKALKHDQVKRHAGTENSCVCMCVKRAYLGRFEKVGI